MSMELNEALRGSKRKKIAAPGWLLRTPPAAGRDALFWRKSLGGIWLAAALLCGAVSQGLPLGFGAGLDLMAAVLVGTMLLALGCWLFAWLFALMRVPWPRLFTGSCVTLFGGMLAVLLVLQTKLFAALTIAAAYALAAGSAGLALAFIWSRLPERRPGPGRLTVAAAIGLLLVSFVSCVSFAGIGGSADDNAESAGESGTVHDGKYAYSVLTYGSGSGRRAEFGSKADIVTSTVDGSKLLTDWSWLQSWYWGFEPERLPVNGTLWMPQGAGPFPLVLIVHGNHIAQQPSDQGYAYLGEMLASKGYAAVSVDENFFNYSPWSGISETDMKLRAWMLLKHLEELRRLSEQTSGPISGQLDTEKVLLIGHSRGGQAAAMAADAGRWFGAEEKELSSAIAGVAALAPTDMNVDGKRAQLNHVSYLTLHGSRDADLTVFYGERQYGRTSFSPGFNGFKSTVYIEDANHSRFNSDWGTMDQALPGGLLLNQQHILSGRQQRTAAALYIGAFADAVLTGDEHARQQLATGAPVPEGLDVFTQFAASDDQPFADFEAADKSRPGDGVAAAASPQLAWSVETLKDRTGDDKGSRGAVFSWQAASELELKRPSGLDGEKETYGWLRLTGLPYPGNVGQDLPSPYDAGLRFTAANRSRELCTDGGLCSPEPVVLSVALRDRHGQEALVELSAALAAPRQERFMRVSWLDGQIGKGKYDDPPETIRQTMRIPFAEFLRVNPALDLQAPLSAELRFRSQNSGSGKLMVDDFSWYAGN